MTHTQSIKSVLKSSRPQVFSLGSWCEWDRLRLLLLEFTKLSQPAVVPPDPTCFTLTQIMVSTEYVTKRVLILIDALDFVI